MSPVQPGRATIRLLAAVAALLAVAVGVQAPAASAEPCPSVELVFARGTAEPEGIGRVGQALADAIQAEIGSRTLATYGVIYPAGYDFLTAADGATDATNHLAAMAADCPSTRIVLGGYSQGAAVVDMLAGVPPLGDRIGSIGSGPPLPPDAADNVSAVAVFGNPATKFGNPLTNSGAFAGRAIDLCADGDPVCSDGRNPFAHKNYESEEFIPQAASFVTARL